MQLGRSKVFMRNPVYNALQCIAKGLQVHNATAVQSAARVARSRALVARLRYEAQQRAQLCAAEAVARAPVEGEWALGAWERAEAMARGAVAVTEDAAIHDLMTSAHAARDVILQNAAEMEAELRRALAQAQKEKVLFWGGVMPLPMRCAVAPLCRFVRPSRLLQSHVHLYVSNPFTVLTTKTCHIAWYIWCWVLTVFCHLAINHHVDHLA